MALTGRAEGPPLGPPAPLVPRLTATARRIADDSAAMGEPVELDPLALLGERAAACGLTRQGAVSCGGYARLLRAVDGWYAVSLARPDDVALVPAWLEQPGADADPWAALSLTTMDVVTLVERGRLLGVPVAPLPTPPGHDRPVRAVAWGEAEPRRWADLTVLDLSSLWAGPLCASVLGLAGARVVKVESTGRPDSMRHGDPVLFDLVNGGKDQVALDLADPDGQAELRQLVRNADVVIEASRPRALRRMGIDGEAELSHVDGATIWISMTGYGRTPPGGEWVAFGDDAAVAGGLVVTDERRPCFCADAVADPATGLAAAAAALRAIRTGGRWLLDVAMADVAGQLAGATLPVDPDLAGEVAPPRVRRPGRPFSPDHCH